MCANYFNSNRKIRHRYIISQLTYRSLVLGCMHFGAPSPSGKAEVCKTSITSSNLVGASTISPISL